MKQGPDVNTDSYSKFQNPSSNLNHFLKNTHRQTPNTELVPGAVRRVGGQPCIMGVARHSVPVQGPSSLGTGPHDLPRSGAEPRPGQEGAAGNRPGWPPVPAGDIGEMRAVCGTHTLPEESLQGGQAWGSLPAMQ